MCLCCEFKSLASFSFYTSLALFTITKFSQHEFSLASNICELLYHLHYYFTSVVVSYPCGKLSVNRNFVDPLYSFDKIFSTIMR